MPAVRDRIFIEVGGRCISFRIRAPFLQENVEILAKLNKNNYLYCIHSIRNPAYYTEKSIMPGSVISALSKVNNVELRYTPMLFDFVFTVS